MAKQPQRIFRCLFVGHITLAYAECEASFAGHMPAFEIQIMPGTFRRVDKLAQHTAADMQI